MLNRHASPQSARITQRRALPIRGARSNAYLYALLPFLGVTLEGSEFREGLFFLLRVRLSELLHLTAQSRGVYLSTSRTPYKRVFGRYLYTCFPPISNGTAVVIVVGVGVGVVVVGVVAVAVAAVAAVVVIVSLLLLSLPH